jgi:hypothetical protein
MSQTFAVHVHVFSASNRLFANCVRQTGRFRLILAGEDALAVPSFCRPCINGKSVKTGSINGEYAPRSRCEAARPLTNAGKAPLQAQVGPSRVAGFSGANAPSESALQVDRTAPELPAGRDAETEARRHRSS